MKLWPGRSDSSAVLCLRDTSRSAARDFSRRLATCWFRGVMVSEREMNSSATANITHPSDD